MSVDMSLSVEILGVALGGLGAIGSVAVAAVTSYQKCVRRRKFANERSHPTAHREGDDWPLDWTMGASLSMSDIKLTSDALEISYQNDEYTPDLVTKTVDLFRTPALTEEIRDEVAQPPKELFGFVVWEAVSHRSTPPVDYRQEPGNIFARIVSEESIRQSDGDLTRGTEETKQRVVAYTADKQIPEVEAEAKVIVLDTYRGKSDMRPEERSEWWKKA
jgi:hypothetical protein